MVLVHPDAFYAGRDLVISGVTVPKGTELSPTQVGKFLHLDAAVDRGLIKVSPDPHQRRKNPTHGPHSSATMIKDRVGLRLWTSPPGGSSHPLPTDWLDRHQVLDWVDEDAPGEQARASYALAAHLAAGGSDQQLIPVLQEIQAKPVVRMAAAPVVYPDWSDSAAVLAWVGEDRDRAVQAMGEHQTLANAQRDHELIRRLEQIAYPPPDIAYDPDWTIPEVKSWVGDDLDRAMEAYEREQARAGGPRTTLVEWLAPMLSNPEPPSDPVEE